MAPPRPAKGGAAASVRAPGSAKVGQKPLPLSVRPEPLPAPLVRLDGRAPADRPTPRSTVIPRLPAPAPVRQPFQTLIFHGAPPVASVAEGATPEPTDGEGMDRVEGARHEDVFHDVYSNELLDGAGEEDGAYEGPHERLRVETAVSDRPPPILVPLLRTKRRGSYEFKVIAAIAAAIALPIGLALFLERPSHPAPVATVAPRVEAPAAPAAPAAPPRAPGTCAASGSGGRLLARRALVRGGIEATSFNDRVAFATLTSAKSGTAFELDARTLDVKGSARVVATEAIRHVVPELGDEAPVEAQADTGVMRTLADAEGDSAVGAQGGYVVWGPRDGDGMVRLWRLPWPQTIDAARVVALGTSGERVIVFRRAGAIWAGSFRGGQTTSELVRLSKGDFVGVPTLDARTDEAIVAWAQRDSAGAPWGIRWARWAPHAGQSAVHALDLPPGGPGDRAMAPSVAALDDRRFLLSWTEAGHGKNQVRAQVVDADDRPLGDALAISPKDAVAGQEQIALADGDRGAVAYLVARRGSFELRATGIDCSR